MPRFFCVNDGVPPETIALLRQACEAREVSFEVIEAASFDYMPERTLAPGDMLYNPSVSYRAELVERHLFGPGVIGLRGDPLGPYSGVGGAPAIFMRHGLPTPRGFPVAAVTLEHLSLIVEELQGFPIVVKVPGGSAGVGVMRADTMPALKSLLDYLVSRGVVPWVSALVADASCWRVIVIGDRAVAACLNPLRDGDFRSGQASRPEDFTADVPRDLADLAISAARLLRLELAGVDILHHATGRLYLLEANFPCYFAPMDEIGKLDVAGALVGHLLAKRDAQAKPTRARNEP